MNITTYFFIAGLVLFEKGEGILEGLVVTPLQTNEYLASKTATLTLLALVENLIIIVLVYGFEFRLLPLLGGLVFTAGVYVLLGFVVVARYDSINEYLMPASLFVGLLQLPWIGYFNLWNPQVFYVFPTQGPLLLLKWAFHPIETWQIVYAVVYSLVWIAIFYVLARKSFRRFIIKTRGV
jgi:fluoroquinolone transport system permease protein